MQVRMTEDVTVYTTVVHAELGNLTLLDLGAVTNAKPGKPFTIEELKKSFEQMQVLMAKNDVRKSSAYFDIMDMEPCCCCGHKAQYLEQPRESIVICSHMLEALKKKCGSVATGSRTICGFDIIVVG